jgi:2-haloacid dehalogenase
MGATFAFDVYGTLIDPLGVGRLLRSYVGDMAPAFAQAWRDKQLEYSFRRALMRDYRDFTACTRDALTFTDQRFRTELPAAVRDRLMEQYRQLPAFPDVVEALGSIAGLGHRLYAFSNGHPDELKCLLEAAGLDSYLDGIVSVHPTASFKPDPAVYQAFLDATGARADRTWLVSGNPFDILGAQAVGWNTVWIRRDPAAVFDPWGREPTVSITDLRELASVVEQGLGRNPGE